MSVTAKYGADLFRSSINACVMLDQGNNRFSEEYAPLMDRLLHATCTYSDVNLFNTRVLNANPGLHADDCWDGRVITFRNKVFNVPFFLLQQRLRLSHIQHSVIILI